MMLRNNFYHHDTTSVSMVVYQVNLGRSSFAGLGSETHHC